MNKITKQIKDKYGERAVIFSMAFVLGILTIFIFQYTQFFSKESYFDGLLVEGGGFLLDILLFGIILGIYEHQKVKKDKIIRYHEELEDYRGWKEKEASYRVFGLIKRLHSLNEYSIDLTDCYFEDVQFNKSTGEGFNFHNIILNNTKFINCSMKYSNFSLLENSNKIIDASTHYINGGNTIDFINCYIFNVKFEENEYNNIRFKEGTNISHSSFKNSVFKTCHFTDIKYEKLNIENSTFSYCTFTGIDFSQILINEKTVFTNKCIFENCINEDKLNIK